MRSLINFLIRIVAKTMYVEFVFARAARHNVNFTLGERWKVARVSIIPVTLDTGRRSYIYILF